MITLIAIAPEDGWAFFQDNNRTYLIRPPYLENYLMEVPPSIAEKAIMDQGFTACEIAFSDSRLLVQHLEQEVAKANQARATKMAPFEAFTRIIKHAPLHILRQYIARIETDLISEKDWASATKALTALLEVKTVIEEDPVRNQVITLLKACGQSLEQESKQKKDIFISHETLSRNYPKASQKYGGEQLRSFVKRVLQNGQLLAMEF